MAQTDPDHAAFELLPLHHVQLAIPGGGEDACRAFWRDVLGRVSWRSRRSWPPAVAAVLEAAGHEVTWDDEFPGHDRFYSADPFGNRLEFLEPTG